jgi:hypothetical protein
MNDQLHDVISKNRPSLSKNSIKTYISILSNLWKKLNADKDPNSFDIDFFTKEQDLILKHLHDNKPARRKTILASLLAVCTDESCQEKYRTQMLSDVGSYNHEQQKQEKTETQSKNWITMDDIHKKYKEISDDASSLLNKKELTNNQYHRIVDLIIMACLAGIYIPPRRLLDFCHFKIRDIEPENDNFLRGRKMIFNTYKTAKTYGSQEVSIPPKLFSLLSRWIKINPTDHLIFDTNMKPFVPSRLTRRLNTIFGKNISVNILRHVYISEYLKDTPLLDELNQKAEELGHSVDQMMLYRKK